MHFDGGFGSYMGGYATFKLDTNWSPIPFQFYEQATIPLVIGACIITLQGIKVSYCIPSGGWL